MASGHLGHEGRAPGVTQPGGTPGSTTVTEHWTPVEERDLIGETGQPGRHRAHSDLAEEVPVDSAARLAAERAPGQRLATGEG